MSKSAEGWIRHRAGRKCPVESGVKVDYRMRSKKEAYGERAELLDWGLDNECPASDIMAYRPHNPAEQVEACSKPELQIRLPDGYGEIYSAQAVEHGPIQWRDRITTIDFDIHSLTAERAELVQKLASEGFALIGRINDLLTDAAQKHEDMSDPKNWRNGDIVECIVNHEDYFTSGSRYVVDYMECDWVNIHADDDGDENAIRPHKVKFHSRPSA